MTALIELEMVARRYPGSPPVEALRDVTLRVDAGELVAVVGPSGSGKSTLLQLIGILDRPTEGTVRIAGHDVATLTDGEMSALRACSIGFVFQQFFLSPGRSALDNVADGLLYAGASVRKRRHRAAEALERVGLDQRLDHRPYQLSGGEKQRVAMARAVVGNPELVLADEPTGNLDSVSGAGVMDLLRQLNAAGTTVLVITHDRELSESFPRQVRVLDGRLMSESELAA